MTGHEAAVAATYVVQALGVALMALAAYMATRLPTHEVASTSRGDCPQCGGPLTHYNDAWTWCHVCGWKARA